MFGKYTDADITAGSIAQDKDELLGYVLRTRSKVKPVFISPRHRVDADGDLAFMRTRLAHNVVNELRSKYKG